VDGKIVVPVTNDVKLQTGGGYNLANKNWNLNVTVGVDVGGGLNWASWPATAKAIGGLPTSDAFRAMPEPPSRTIRPAGFIGLGISGRI